MVNIDEMKTMPMDLESEKLFLSSLFIDNTLVSRATVMPEHLHSNSNKKIYKAIRALDKANKDVFPSTVNDKMWGDWIDELYEISSHAMTARQGESAQESILDKYNRRQIIKTWNELVAMSRNSSSNVDEIIIKAMDLSKKVAQEDKTHKLIAQMWETMMKYFDWEWSPVILEDMWLKFFSAYFGWWRWWALYIFAWWPWEWKSTLVMNLIVHALKQWVQCSRYSFESPAHEISWRFMSCEAKVKLNYIEKWREEILKDVTDVIDWLDDYTAECNIIDETMTIDKLEMSLAKECLNWSKIIAIDYIQLVKFVTNNRNIEVGNVSTMLKRVAMKYKVAIIGLSQLSREWQKLADWPELTSLRDSWSLEQDADVVAFIWWYDENWCPPDTWIKLAKNRHGKKKGRRQGWIKENFYLYDIRWPNATRKVTKPKEERDDRF